MPEITCIMLIILLLTLTSLGLLITIQNFML